LAYDPNRWVGRKMRHHLMLKMLGQRARQ
jgi:hypothetical protein